MPQVDTNGIRMHYEERGSGDPLLCIMGITAPGAVWELHAQVWEQHFRCILGDNRGVGGSDKPEGPYSSAMMADDYAGLLDALGIEQVRVAGCSMGGIIAQQLALRHPEKVRSAVMMCTWARCDRYARSIFEHMKDCKARLRPEEFMKWVQLLIFTKTFWDNEDGWSGILQGQSEASLNPDPQPLHALEAQAAACVDHQTLDQLGSIRCPVLLTQGREDIFTPYWMAEELHHGIRGSELFVIEKAGHAHHWEDLEAFNGKTTEWLLAH
ncbi:MAG TPA: alpha/beta hydrolase [Verrucomicrobiales bacterium]|nr:alpha/beta hydrolase [Verrucomicrobiales bacterium]